MGVGAPQLPTAKPSRGTLAAYLGPPWFSLRGYHPLRRGFPAHFGYHGSGPSSVGGLNPTSPYGYPVGVWFGLPPFRSPLLRGSLLVSLPPPTKMFPFGGFPSGTPRSPGFPGCHGVLPRGGSSHSGIPGSTAACAFPGHIAACRALLRRPSRAIHRAASCRCLERGWYVSGLHRAHQGFKNPFALFCQTLNGFGNILEGLTARELSHGLTPTARVRR